MNKRHTEQSKLTKDDVNLIKLYIAQGLLSVWVCQENASSQLQKIVEESTGGRLSQMMEKDPQLVLDWTAQRFMPFLIQQRGVSHDLQSILGGFRGNRLHLILGKDPALDKIFTFAILGMI